MDFSNVWHSTLMFFTNNNLHNHLGTE